MRADLALVAQELTEREIDVCGEGGGLACLWVLRTFDNELAARATDFLVDRPLRIAFILLLALVVNRLGRRGIRRFVASMQTPTGPRMRKLREKAPSVLLATSPTPSIRAAQRAETIGAILRSVVTVVVWSIAALTILGELGINLGPLIAGAGILGIALGFGAQTLVRDFLTGLFMLIEDQFGVGDIIDAGEASGVVEGISLRTTRLRDVNGVVWHIPNGEIHRIGNMSQEWSRALIDVDVAYDTDLDHAIRVVKEVADEVWRDEMWGQEIVAEPEVWGVERFDADGIAIRLVIKVRPAVQWKLMREVRRRLKAAFDREGIEIPFPQRTVWIRQEAGHDDAGGGDGSGAAAGDERTRPSWADARDEP